MNFFVISKDLLIFLKLFRFDYGREVVLMIRGVRGGRFIGLL